jgi:hypothetical protein
MLKLYIIFACYFALNLAHAKYIRKEWAYGKDEVKNCLYTRAEILKYRSQVHATLNKKGCTILRGKWDDYYYPETHILAKNVEIDHLVPLKHAYETGAASWSSQQKKKFANDPLNLAITNKKYNRVKSDKGIDRWLPLHKEYACKYINDWIKIKNLYKLQFTDAEVNTIKVSGCVLST